ncbi:tumor necrosis factor receptor superfamily member 4 isoform X2 [Chelmon rostratus]|uniref:tumor necrosis factor receptor superfamily member 4 isoform X2 n=1 Tax=Chelmon rostratus TaxID=109905 RepID=UPI001BE9D506|nr:tumor necrosis factor receptor superfamily member 4 isoform X2 [Chelmon rostratus]
MVLPKLLIFTLTLHGLLVNLDAVSCPKGQKVSRGGRGCEDCSDGYYQPVENYSRQCMACTRCDERSGSVVKEKCTKESDTKCECRGEFVGSDSDYSTCKCDIGFGLSLGECSKCADGYFSTSIDSSCQKWKECKSAGVSINGTQTSDVICNKESQSNTYVTTATTSNKDVSLITRLISHRPHEGAQTQKTHTTTTTTSAPGPTVTPKDKGQPSYPSNTGNHIGMVLLIFGIIGLLVLTAVTCRLHLTPHMERRPAVQSMLQNTLKE